MEKLKPCPFCGAKLINFEHSMETLENRTRHTLEAKCSCGMAFKKVWGDVSLFRLDEHDITDFGFEKAIKFWNTRTEKGR